MASIHADLIRRHRRMIRHQIQEYNSRRDASVRLSQKSIDILLYLNYLRFIHATAVRAQELSTLDGSQEIMPTHWTVAAEEFLQRFRFDPAVDEMPDVDQEQHININ